MLDRLDKDQYYSPRVLIAKFFEQGADKRPIYDGWILEPCNGEGAISDTLANYGHHHLTCTDIDNGLQYDASDPSYWWIHDRHDWVFTNPPYRLAADILRLALENTSKGVTMLLRLSFLEPCKSRRDMLTAGLSHITIVNPRPKFRSDSKGSDSSTVAFITWTHGYQGNPNVNYLVDWHLTSH